jgi:hypothetical protein
MAIPTGGQVSYATLGQRESLEDMIYRISPTETPLLSMVAKKTSAKAIREDWQTGDLAAAAANAQIEGDDVATFASYLTARLGNICQILTKAFAVSDTLEAVDEAGRASELGLQLAAKSAELKRDLELALLSNQAAVVGNATTARKMAGLPAWMITNTPTEAADTNPAGTRARGTGGVQPVIAAGLIGTAAVDGTIRAFLQTQLDNSIQRAWTSGGKPTVLLAGGKQRSVFSGFDGVAGTVFHEAKDKQIVGRADIYLSNFFDIRVVPDRFIRATSGIDREVFGIDEDHIAVAQLRPFGEKPLAKTGDSEKRLLTWEGTLKVQNDAAHFCVADLS